jgi:hypothetical protein
MGEGTPGVDHSSAEHYQREAATLREAAEEVQDERLRQQLIEIAESYDGVATSIDPTSALSSSAGPRGFGSGWRV